MRSGFLVVLGVVWWLCAASMAGGAVVSEAAGDDSAQLSSLESFLATAPPSAEPLAPLVRRVEDVFASRAARQQEVKRLRTERDRVNTELTALNSEVEMISQHRQQVKGRLPVTKQWQEERVAFLRGGLEARMNEELTRAEQQITAELEQDLTRQLQAFEARQREAITQDLERQLDGEERELEQVAQEVEVQTQQLLDRLARLDAKTAAASMEGSIQQALESRKQEFQARRTQLEGEREALVVEQRQAFLATLQQQRDAEHRRRMTLKEAELRQAMAELFYRTRLQDAEEVTYLQKALDEVDQRYNQLGQRQEELGSSLKALEEALASEITRLDGHQGEWDEALAQIEEGLQRVDLSAHPEALTWYNQAVEHLAPELTGALGPLPQRVLAKAEQERQLEAQRRALRERQLALQLSRELEGQREQERLKQQQEQEARVKRADALLAKADQLAGHGAFDEALQFLGEAQALQLDLTQMSRVIAAREEVIAAKEGALRQARADALQRMFDHATEVFEAGRFEEAIALFEQVIAEEATLKDSAQLVAEATP